MSLAKNGASEDTKTKTEPQLLPAGNGITILRTAEKKTSNKKLPLSEKQKTALKIGAAVAGTALATYGIYKLSKYLKSEAAAKSVSEGKKFVEQTFNKKIDELLDKDNEYTDSHGTLLSPYRDELHSYVTARRETLANADADARTKKVSKSAIAAADYLLHPEKYQVDANLVKWYK